MNRGFFQRWGRRVARAFEPSLVRRLLVTQWLLLLAVWALLAASLLHHSGQYPPELAHDQRYALILGVADSLAGQPALQLQSLRDFDAFQRATEAVEDDAELRVGMLLRQGDRLLFASPGLPPAVRNSGPGVLEDVVAGGQTWRARTLVSPRSNLALTLAKPAGGFNVVLSRSSWSLLLSPLIISLPFLALPAWLSLRLALRPWSRVARELADRGPQDLRPLAFQPRHRELWPLVQNINALLARVRDSARRERDFVADAAHELRTPLAAMRVNAEAMEQPASASQRQELLDGMLRSGERAARVATQLLSLVRADAALPAARRRFDLTPLVQDRLATLSCLAAARGVALVLDAPRSVPVVGEPEGLGAMVDNLVDNAIKYSPAGGAVDVQIAVRDDAVVLTVADQGPGIPAAWHARVFDRFFRAPDQSQTGSGLGLAIVQSVAQRHGAVVALHTPRGGSGLLVSVELPHAEP